MSNPAGNGRMTLLLIGGIPIIIILASTWLWFYVASGKLNLVDMLGTANQGSLVEPAFNLEVLAATDRAGEAFNPTASDEPLWRILIPLPDACDSGCQELFRYIRQIHTAMGKYQGRIERVLLVSDTQAAQASAAALAGEYPELNLLYTSASSLRERTSSPVIEGQAPAYFVADPYGWVILAYRGGADGKDIMADLKFLLKNSN